MGQNNSKLRFAALRRVSTEQQEKKGESLRTQKTEIEKAVKQLGGIIVGWYGGQEHATVGHEKKEIDRLLNDAQKKGRRFNAFIITNADRWSRDNQKSKQGLDVFTKQGIRFFVGVSEYNLFDPTQLFYLEMSSVIGGFQARNQKQKSLVNRIHRAKRGLPACGKKPFGRTFDKDTGKWDVDEAKKLIIEDIAKRYLSGEKLSCLAEEYGMNHANLHKILTKRSGNMWTQTFNSDDLNIHETVDITIPRLLDEKVLKAIRKKTEANKTYNHGEIKHPYLLRRVIFCKHCGYTMFGQTNHNGHQYYRHARNRVKECKKWTGWVRAAEIEDIVMCYLFECFGNPQAVQQAIEKALPNLEKIQEYQKRIERIEVELNKISKGREKILRLVTKGLLTERQTEKQLEELNQKELKLQSEQNRLEDSLENKPSRDVIKAMSKKVSNQFKKRSVRLGTIRRRAGAKPYSKMTCEEKRALVELVFSDKTTDGKRMGVYIEWNKQGWTFNIHGHLIDEEGLLPMSDSMKEAYFGNLDGGGYKQRELLTESTLYCRARCLP
jgi:DNA invertase Pin-like site-specific DNA recombinase